MTEDFLLYTAGIGKLEKQDYLEYCWFFCIINKEKWEATFQKLRYGLYEHKHGNQIEILLTYGNFGMNDYVVPTLDI